MGASITMAKGAADAGLVPSVCVIGDSTFTHSGITGLLDAVNDNSNVVIIISDNRYGVRNSKIINIIITHQLMLKLPKFITFLEKPINFLIKYLVSKFDLCLIPDNPLPNSLAGDLVHKYPLPKNAKLIGPLSRFTDFLQSPPKEKEISPLVHLQSAEENVDVLAIISGPEPQRTILLNKLIEKLSSENLNCLIVTGTFNESEKYDSYKNIKFVPHIESSKMAEYIKKTPIIISRAGYSTIMDLWYLKRNAILIPTPGQTEQEYLSQIKFLQNHTFIKQSEISAFNFIKVVLC